MKGQINVCKWLHAHGAAPDATSWDKQGVTSMHLACSSGHLSVCKWLFEVGAAADITKPDTHGATPMWVACRGGHLSVCKWLFEVGAAQSITTPNKYGSTPMLKACNNGHLPVCEWLFEVGAAADITKTNKCGESPMFWASQGNHLHVCTWLVFNGALNNPSGHVDRTIVYNTTRKHGRLYRRGFIAWADCIVAAHRAFRFGFLPGTLFTAKKRGSAHLWMLASQGAAFSRMFKGLVASYLGNVVTGRRLRTAREFGEALAEVSKEENAVAEWLRREGYSVHLGNGLRGEVAADLSRRDASAFGAVTPMARACEQGNLRMCKLLYYYGARAEVRKHHERDENPLWWASKNGHLSVCQWLGEMSERADVNKTNGEKGLTPMSIAMEGGHLAVCQWLIKAGAIADVTTPNKYGSTPMHIACKNGHLSICKLLFEMGAAADVRKTNKHGSTPMHMACWNGQLSVCKWLFEVGAAADVTKSDCHGNTPMLIACQEGHLSVCKWLFEVGADITTANNHGVTPFRNACKKATAHNRSVCKWLILNGALNKVANGEDEKTSATADIGHVDEALVRQEAGRGLVSRRRRPALLEWAQGVTAIHHTFRFAFLPGTLSTPTQRRSSAHLWMLSSQGPLAARTFKERIEEFAWGRVEKGRRLRNVREFAEIMEAIFNPNGHLAPAPAPAPNAPAPKRKPICNPNKPACKPSKSPRKEAGVEMAQQQQTQTQRTCTWQRTGPICVVS
jgi:ankyrin repeat protein